VEIEGGSGSKFEVEADAPLIGRIWAVLPATQQTLFEAEFSKVAADKAGSTDKQLAKLKAQQELAEAKRLQEEYRRKQARAKLELELLEAEETGAAAAGQLGMLETVTDLLGRLTSPSRERAKKK